MTKIDKEAEIKKAITQKNIAAIEWKNIIRIEDVEEPSSSSSMSMCSLDSDKEDSEVPSHWSPTLIEAPLPEHLEEVHSSPTMEKILSERHSIIHEEENPSSYNIEEIFDAFIFNLYKKERSRKRIWNEKKNGGTMNEI